MDVRPLEAEAPMAILPVSAAAWTCMLHARREPIEESAFLIYIAHLHSFAVRAGHRDFRAGPQTGRHFSAGDRELIIKPRSRDCLRWQ